MTRRRARILAIALAVLAASAGAVDARRPRAPAPATIANHAFRSLPGDAPRTVWAVGDGAERGETALPLARRIIAARPDLFLYLGDVYPSGTAADFRAGYDRVYGPLASRTAPTPGNHEWPSHVTGYDAYWRARTGAPTPPWYRIRAGGWQILSLNSEAPHGPGSPQLAWLRAQLTGTTTCRLAIWHRPRFSAKPGGDEPDIAPLWDALAGHAALVLSGHDHDLQRLRPDGGIVQLVAGAGGRGHGRLRSGDRQVAWSDANTFGALRLRLRPGRADVAFVSAGGRILDRSRVACRP
jgi:hypothetical protein